MTTISKYTNGNITVTIEDDGTKIREYDGIPEPQFPESIDLNITEYCDLDCEFCHEDSNRKGKHATYKDLINVVSYLPAGVELAIGGGNPLSNPSLIPFLNFVKQRGLIANITINQKHILKNMRIIKNILNDNLVKGIGVSVNGEYTESLKKLCRLSDNVVFHVIAGVHDVDFMDKLIILTGNPKILVLGYKKFGRGIPHYNKNRKKVDSNIKKWYMYIPKYIDKCVISFDNLAIEQLKIKRLFTDEGWDKFYMGDDFTFTMYVDAVNKIYAPTSSSSDRKSWEGNDINSYFKKYRNKDVAVL